MVKPVDAANWMIIEKLIATINGKFGQRNSFVLSDISFALFYHYLYGLLGESEHLAKRNRCLYGVMDYLEQQGDAALTLSQQPFYFNCLANLMQGIYAAGEEGYPQLAARLDKWNERLLQQSCINATLGRKGYLTGWAGILHYYITLPETFGQRRLLLSRLFDQVATLLRVYGSELIFLPDDRGPTEIGLAEGACGILTVLLQVREMTGDKQLCSIIENSVHQLISLRQEVDQSEDKCSFFPYEIDNGKKVAFYDNRLGWHSSDLGHALLLCRAGALCGNNNYKKMAEMVALNTLLRRSETHTAIHDASLQQGAAGVALLYKKLFEFIENEDLIKGYHSWMTSTMELAERDLATGKFEHKAADMLEGPVGIALTLMAYENEDIAGWSKVLLI